jgi:chorismate mutase-like protein
MDLQSLRIEIDNINKQILALLNQRAHLAKQIGEEKKKLGMSVEDKQREQQIYDSIVAQNDGPISDNELVNIFQTIIETCKNIQR